MYVPSSVCRKLALANPAYRYGLAYVPGQGRIFFLAMLVPRKFAGSDDADNRPALGFHVADLGDRLVYVCDKNGDIPCRVPAEYALCLMGWPGQKSSFGNAAVMAGDHADFLLNHGKPVHAVQLDHKEAVRAAGRAMDRHISDTSADIADYWKYLARDGGSDPIYTREETRRGFKDPANDHFFRVHEKDKSVSFEAEYLRNEGLSD